MPVDTRLNRDFWPIALAAHSGENWQMRLRTITDDLQRTAGFVTWVAVTGFTAYIAMASGDRYAGALAPLLLLGAVNLVAMGIAMGSGTFDLLTRVVALWLQLASAFAAALYLPVDFMPIYTIIWLAIATSYYSLRLCWWLLAAVMLGWYLIMRFVWQDDAAGISAVLYGTFHVFAMLSASNAHKAHVARTEVEALNRELVATQHLLTEASRLNERTRIGRDLHDLLGHHLTALSINLQIAERISDGEVRTKVEECRALARLLLSDVRETVSQLRDGSAIDFTRSISLVIENVPELNINLEIDENLVIDDVEIAEALLRCVQEAITNSLRHAGAQRLWIVFRQDAGIIHLEIRDDGTADTELSEGNGLTGMRERLANIQGLLTLDRVENALRLRIDIPVAG